MRDLAMLRLPEEAGADPAVLVLREDDRNAQFVVHVRVEPRGCKPHHVWGDYVRYPVLGERRAALTEAVEIFNRRARAYKALGGRQLVVI